MYARAFTAPPLPCLSPGEVLDEQVEESDAGEESSVQTLPKQLNQHRPGQTSSDEESWK